MYAMRFMQFKIAAIILLFYYALFFFFDRYPAILQPVADSPPFELQQQRFKMQSRPTPSHHTNCQFNLSLTATAAISLIPSGGQECISAMQGPFPQESTEARKVRINRLNTYNADVLLTPGKGDQNQVLG